MKKQIILIICVLISKFAVSQFSFNKIIVTNQLNNLNLDSANNIYHFESYKLHVYNSSCDTLVNCFFKLNPLNPVCSLTYAFPRLLFKNSLLVEGFAYDTLNGTCNKSYGYLGKYNINLTKEWERKFSVNNSYGNSSLEVAQNDSEIISTAIAYNISGTVYLRYPFVIVFDTAGNLKWCNKFDLLDAYPVSILQTNDGGSVLGMNIKEIGAALLKCDSAGNVLWCKSYYRNNSELIKVIEGENGYLYLTGRKDTTNIFPINFQSSSSFIIKANPMGIPIWGVHYNAIDTASNIQDLIYNQFSNEIIAVGRQYNSTFTRYHFSKFDINGFANSPSTIYFRNDFYLQVNKIQITSPISYLIGGNASNGWSVGGSWLFTADNNGYGICNGFPVTIGYNSFIPVDSDITVTYTTGATVVASNDIYTVGVQPFNVMDGCLYTGEQALNAATNLLVISPNPNVGVFTITLPDNANYNSSFFLSVYDAQGKLVHQQTTKIGNEKINLNLASQPNGIYNIVITNGRVVFNGKIVLQ